ncbi:Anhydro-N-acetylmuramic acid kinase [hydrothermal vent metagenome]|uniref:Anhydro-N-acetylmuramic acid kinase n=1 Tax=hydrothermal vent metagenome TaxID=652676 RepID=A0A3B1B9H1_9ZZZZ
MGYYIGLMSGTSLDAVDAALVSCSNQHCELQQSLALPIADELRQQALSLLLPGDNELARLCRLDVQLGRLFAKAVQALLAQAELDSSMINAIGSHGQTLRHYPDNEFPTSLQIGDPNIIAEQTGITTVADFRRRDMAAGGQGAPLVPAFHQAMLQDNRYNRVVVNIGGIANITVLAKDHNKPVVGFDTGPGNALLDSWTQQHLQQTHDKEGKWAASGTCHPALLDNLLKDPYFSQPPPKSTGRETFNLRWLEKSLQNFSGLPAQDIQATLVELTAITIAQAILKYSPDAGQILICGGGSHNKFLMQCLAMHLPRQIIQPTSNVGIDPDWVEAMAFAWLAKQTLDGQAGNLASVTGARHPLILGGIYPAMESLVPQQHSSPSSQKLFLRY